MAHRPRPLSLIAAVVACVAVGAALPAAASGQVSCGASITTDVRLDANLDCGFGAALTIDADRVTLDLNGHNVFGSVVVEGQDRVTIKDGGVTLLAVRDARRVTIRNVQLGSLVGIDVHRSRFLNSTFGGGGLTITDSSRNLIEGNTIGGSSTPIALESSDRNVIRGNLLSGAQTYGLSLDEGSDRNEIRNNSAQAIGASAIAIGGSRNTISRNTAVGNAPFGSGILSAGIYVFGGRRNVVERNVAGTEGITTETDGILVAAAARRTLVAKNTANGNSDDGIDVESAATTLRGNTANNNRDLGIEAVPGVRDAGGNRATGNGNPLQCLNVACRPGAAATVFTGSAIDPANDLAPHIGDPLPDPPVDFTNVSVRYDAVAGRVDVSYRFSRAPASYQDLHAGVGLGTVQPDGSCNAPIFTDLSWRSESANAFQGEAYVEGHSTDFTGSVTGLVFDDMGGASLGTASFEWSASRRTWDFATINPSLVDRHYTCAHAGMWLTGGPPGSNTGPGVDFLFRQSFALSGLSPRG